MASRLVGMFNVGGGELLVIMLIALIVLGPQRLPDAVRQVGRVVGEVRRVSSGFQQELKDAFDEPAVDAAPRRKESVPLASAVAEAESGPTTEPDAPTTRDDPPPADEPTVAPAVAAALDEIVTPLSGDTSDDDDAVGDERAAS
jgi:sec-independent protein translocase protein TatB